MVVKMTPIERGISAGLVPFVVGLIAGVCGAVLKSWVYIKFLTDLEYRLAECEGRVNRETKKRAQEMSVTSRKGDDDLVTWAKDNAARPNVGQLDFAKWRKDKMVGSGPT